MMKKIVVPVWMIVVLGISLLPGGAAAFDRCPVSGADLHRICQDWCYANEGGLVPQAHMKGCLYGCAKYRHILRNDAFQCEGKVIYDTDATRPFTLPGDPAVCGVSGATLEWPHCKDRCRWEYDIPNGSCIIGCQRYAAKIGEAGCWNKVYHE